MTVIFKEDDYLAHYGILRKSGRYPWGSGEDQSTRNKMFLDTVNDLRAQGMSDKEIAKGFHTKEHPFTTTDLRAAQTIAINEQKQAKLNQINRMAEAGMSNVAIGRELGMNESTVRSMRAAHEKKKADSLENTAAMLRRQVDEKGAIDIGTGVERDLPMPDNPAASIGIPTTKFNTAVAMLKEEGYNVHTIKVDTTIGNQTTFRVLAKPHPDPKQQWRELVMDPGKIKLIQERSEDHGGTWEKVFQPPINVSSKRIGVAYKEDGGAEADGVIYVRPGAKDLSLGGSRYSQVRIAVDGTHYIKGMAVLRDDMPPGVDLLFNTNKSNTGNKLDALKPLKDDPDNPFGAVVWQHKDKNGRVNSAMNIVNDEGKWDTWNKSLPSQMLSKQSPKLAKQQLDLTYENRRRDYEEISSLTNPVVRKKLLEEFADSADSAAVHLQAAAIPRQATRVILPINSMKPNEVFAPHLADGTRVSLVRFPHGGTFEIPEATVNNRNPEARKLIGTQSRDAIGIHHSVAERLSGADFDGDSVLVIPNNRGDIKSTPPLAGLKGFDPKEAYPRYEGMRTVDGGTVKKDGSIDYGKDANGKPRKPRKANMQQQMGNISNLITDMTLNGANESELARAVRHSMVVIDCEKHVLDYKQSAQVNGIAALKKRYQGDSRAGASTLISRAGSTKFVDQRKARPAAEGGPVDRETGRKVFVETGAAYVKDGKTIKKKTEINLLADTHDAHTLVGKNNTTMERIYADHSNRLKSLANQARKDSLDPVTMKKSSSAEKVYAQQVKELNSALNLAKLNAPRERQAQALTKSLVNQKKAANPDLSKEDVKKLQNMALAEMRVRTGAKKDRIEITPEQWKAIQAGAIPKTKLEDILVNADMDKVREYATPKERLLMSPSALTRAKAMAANGFTQAEISAQLGVSLTTLKVGLYGE